MATYFGSARRSYLSSQEMRWLIGGLSAICLLLLVSIVVLVGSDPSPIGAVQPAAAESSPGKADNYEAVLIAKIRIEDGAALDRSMFRTLSLSSDEIPLGAILQKDWSAIDGKFAKRFISPESIVTVDDLASDRPASTISIPPGFRLTTIIADVRELAGGFATPNSRVDVLWIVNDRNGTKLIPLVHHVKIVSVDGNTQAAEWANIQGKVPVTLLVPLKDAHKIELARTAGSLSLSLLGEEQPLGYGAQVQGINIEELKGRPKPEKAQQMIVGGRMIWTNELGKQEVFELIKGQGWTKKMES